MANRKLGKTTDIRLSMLKNLTTDLIWHEQIETTEARAKEVKAIADSLIALAVKEKDNFEEVDAKVVKAKLDAKGNKETELVKSKNGKEYLKVVKEEKTEKRQKDMPSRLNARRTMMTKINKVKDSEGNVTGFKNNAAVRQHSGNIQIFTAMLQQKLKVGIFHLDGEVAYQKSSEQDILPLPELSAYGNLYMKFGLAKKVLQIEMGADVRYFSKYYAPDYSPVIGQFYNQNPDDKIEIGAFPIVNVYANLHLKRTRFFIMMYHVNAGSGKSNYFLAPHYPINPRMIKFGLSWNFFD